MGAAAGRPAARHASARRAVTIDASVFKRVQARAAAVGCTVEELLDSLLAALPATAQQLERAPSRRTASRLSASPPASGSRWFGRQGSLLALYVTDPIITLVAGLLKGDHTVSSALSHGDFGLGTLDQLDGEVVVLEGVAYHQNEAGTRVLSGDERSPFMTVTWFDEKRTVTAQLGPAADFGALQRQLLSGFRSQNCVYAVRITGQFPSIRVRAVCKQPDGTPLIEAAARQLVFDLQGEQGDLVGFWCPEYSGPGIQVPGFHLHYISSDRSRGGHVLQLSLAAGAARTIEIHRCIVDLPSNEAFLRHDLHLEGARDELRAAEADHT